MERMVEAALFDMDGVITDTAKAHAAAWKRAFDEFLASREVAPDERRDPFDTDSDYRAFVDGKPRFDGVESFLDSRGIRLPRGSERDSPDAETVCGLGNRKNRYYRDWLARQAVKTFPGAIALIRTLRRAGVKAGVFSASRNAGEVLRSAQALDLFDTIVSGHEAAELDLPGKPDPAILREASARLQVPPARTAVFEDAIAGVEAGVRGGFGLIVGVDRAHNSEALSQAGAHVVVRHLSEMTWHPNIGLTVKTLATLPLVSDRADELRGRLQGKTLVSFLDYDGTLTPIVEDFTRAFLSEQMRAAVARLARVCTVAVVSGRDTAAVRRLVGLESVYYAGSHGFEIRGPRDWGKSLERGVELLPEIEEAERQLRERLAGIDGHAVERQRFSIAVHYRRAAVEDIARIQSGVDNVLAEHPGLRKEHGKMIFRVQPAIEWDKGHAVRWLLEQLHLDRPDVIPIYVGDDLTDEDAFRAIAGRGISVVVRDADDRPTAADYTLADTADVGRFLQFLTHLAGAESGESSRPPD